MSDNRYDANVVNFMEYANRTQSNIIPKEQFEALIYEVFDVLSSNLERSFGPLGSNTTILDGMMTDGTKDGFTIFKSFRFHNRYKNMIYNLMKTPCTALNNTVGDGTTTAIVLTNYLFKGYNARKNTLETLYRLPRQFTKAWDEVIEEIIERVSTYSTHLDPSDYDSIFNIAYVTSNGNHEISKNFADVYKNSESPVIKMKNSPTNKSYIAPIIGFEFPANLISDKYARTEDLSANLKDICVMVFDHTIDMDTGNNFISPINEVLRAQKKKLLVIAPHFDEKMVDIFIKRQYNIEIQRDGEANLLCAEYELGKLSKHHLTDLAIILRTDIITQDRVTNIIEVLMDDDTDSYDVINESLNNNSGTGNVLFDRIIGVASSALVSCTNGSIFQVDDIYEDVEYQNALRIAEKELKDVTLRFDKEQQAYSFEISKARARISQLKMENYIYYIGADSTLQKRIIEDAVEDVIKCIRSAIKTGVVPGCQISIVRACHAMIQEITEEYKDVEKIPDNVQLELTILDIIIDGVINTYSSVLHGPYPYLGMVKLIEGWQFYDHNNKEAIDALRKKSLEKGGEIIHESIQRNQVFDLETLEYSDKIVTSAETDIMVLTASSELIKILISGNQCVFLDSEVNDNHDTTVQVYT